MENIIDRARKEREAREKWKSEYQSKVITEKEKEKKMKEQLLKENEYREEVLLESRKHWEAYKETPEYHQEREKRRKERYDAHYEEVEKVKSIVKGYKTKYEIDGTMKQICREVIKREGLSTLGKFPSWVNYQINTENYVPLQIFKRENTKCIRFYGRELVSNDEVDAMYLFGQRLNVCYYNTFEELDDVTWSYNNSPDNDYVNFYYHTDNINPTIQLQGFIAAARQDEIDLNGEKIIYQDSILSGSEIYHTEKFVEKTVRDELWEDLKSKLEDNDMKQIWLGDHGKFIGDELLTPYEFNLNVWDLKRKIEKEYGVLFNGCLVTLSEGEEISYNNIDGPVGIVTLGFKRRVHVTGKEDHDIIDLTMEKGDTLVFRKHNHQYRFPKIKKNQNQENSKKNIVFVFQMYNYDEREKELETKPF